MGRQRAEAGALDEARTLLLRAVQYDPQFPLALRALAGVEFSLGNPAEARQLLERVLALVPPDVETYFLQGNLAMNDGDTVGALAAYRIAETLGGESPELLFNMGLAHLFSGDGLQAAASFTQLVEMVPDHARAWDALGCAQRLQRNRPAALEAFNRALALDPSLNDTRDHLAQLLLESGNAPGAQQVMVTALEIDPERASSQHLLGMAYASQQQFHEAAACWETLVRMTSPVAAETYHLLANAYLHLHAKPQAVDTLITLVTHYPDHLPGHLQLGLLLLERGEGEEGWRHLELARALDPRNPTVAHAFTAARAMTLGQHTSADR